VQVEAPFLKFGDLNTAVPLELVLTTVDALVTYPDQMPVTSTLAKIAPAVLLSLVVMVALHE
jgi:hypothetical protein